MQDTHPQNIEGAGVKNRSPAVRRKRDRTGRYRNPEVTRAARKRYNELNADKIKAHRALPHVKAARRARKARENARKRAWVAAYKAARGCIDCGERDPVVLDLDHCEDKIADVSELVRSAGRERLAAEMEKCVVRCSNCHRRKTHRERDYLNPPRSTLSLTESVSPELQAGDQWPGVN